MSTVCEDIKNVLRKNNIDLSPGLAIDTCVYVIEELHLEKLNLPSRFVP